MRVLGWVLGVGMVGVAAGLAAQQPRIGDRDVTFLPSGTMTITTITPACPVGFRASVDPRLTMRAVRHGAKDVDSTRLQLDFDTVDAKKTIVSASVTAHGVAPHGELMLVAQNTEENRMQAFELTRAKGTGGLVQTEVEVTSVPFVRWVELNQITYADGSVWHAAEGTVCKSVLSKFHPV